MKREIRNRGVLDRSGERERRIVKRIEVPSGRWWKGEQRGRRRGAWKTGV